MQEFSELAAAMHRRSWPMWLQAWQRAVGRATLHCAGAVVLVCACWPEGLTSDAACCWRLLVESRASAQPLWASSQTCCVLFSGAICTGPRRFCLTTLLRKRCSTACTAGVPAEASAAAAAATVLRARASAGSPDCRALCCCCVGVRSLCSSARQQRARARAARESREQLPAPAACRRCSWHGARCQRLPSATDQLIVLPSRGLVCVCAVCCCARCEWLQQDRDLYCCLHLRATTVNYSLAAFCLAFASPHRTHRSSTCTARPRASPLCLLLLQRVSTTWGYLHLSRLHTNTMPSPSNNSRVVSQIVNVADMSLRLHDQFMTDPSSNYLVPHVRRIEYPSDRGIPLHVPHNDINQIVSISHRCHFARAAIALTRRLMTDSLSCVAVSLCVLGG